MIKLKRINPNLLSDQELLNIIREEYYEIQPKGCWDFFKRRRKSPSLPYLKKRFNMTYHEILMKAGIPREELKAVREKEQDKSFYLDRLNKLAIELGHTPTIKEYREHGFSPERLRSLFGSYNNAIKEAGLTPRREMDLKKRVKKKELLRIYKDISNELGRPATLKDIKKYCKQYRASLFVDVFGGMNQLKKEAGFIFEEKGNIKYTKDQITELLITEYQKHKRHLTAQEIEDNDNLPCYITVMRHFKATTLEDVWREIDSILATKHLNSKVLEQSFGKNQDNSQRKRRFNRAGKIGEKRVAHYLNFLNKQKYKVYNDINIKFDNLEQQIDHLVIGENGIFHLETKNYAGSISIDRDGNWIQTTRTTMNTIENPEGQISRHEEILRKILNEKYEIISILVYSNPKCTLHQMDRTQLNVMKVERVINFITNYKSSYNLGPKEITEICNLIEKHMVKSDKTAM